MGFEQASLVDDKEHTVYSDMLDEREGVCGCIVDDLAATGLLPMPRGEKAAIFVAIGEGFDAGIKFFESEVPIPGQELQADLGKAKKIIAPLYDLLFQLWEKALETTFFLNIISSMIISIHWILERPRIVAHFQ